MVKYEIYERDEIIRNLKERLRAEPVVSIQGLNDGEALRLNYTAGRLGKTIQDTIPDDTLKYRFGRILNVPLDTSMVFNIKWDSAIVHLSYQGTGKFKVSQLDSMLKKIEIDSSWNFFTVIDTLLDSVAADTGDTVYIYVERQDSTLQLDTTRVYQWGVRDSTLVDFAYSTFQSVVFLRKGISKKVEKDWYLDAVTPMLINTAPLDTIEKVKISSFFLNQDLVIEWDSLSKTYLKIESLPRFQQSTYALVEVTVQAVDDELYAPGEIVVLHYGRDVNYFKYRRAMEDENNDGTYEYNIKWHGACDSILRLFIDFISMDSIFIPGTPLHAMTWMIPYRVIR